MQQPPPLQQGDRIALSAPARKISREELQIPIDIIEKAGYKVVFDERLFAADHQFAGSDDHRASLLQDYLNDSSIKAVFFVRGGYGSLRLIDSLDFGRFRQNPKWLIGYSDITVIHARLQQLGFESLHASMPVNFKENTTEALQSLFNVLENKFEAIAFESHALNSFGQADAEVVGGNLSTLYSLLGSELFPETAGKILFLEDLDEYLYHIDRMMLALKRAGKLEKLAGLLIGGMTDMNDNRIPFGKSAIEIIAEHIDEYHYPRCYGFPAGHINDNRALVLGRKSKLRIGVGKSELEQ